jgi:hypothetical protein
MIIRVIIIGVFIVGSNRNDDAKVAIIIDIVIYNCEN